MDIAQIKKNLKTKMIGREICYYKEIGSTNDEAKRLAKLDAEEGTVVIAENQTHGKGRLGRRWDSKEGESLTFSVIVKPHISSSKRFPITLLGALSAVRTIRLQTDLQVKVKWPNDIVIEGKKVGGVLSEASQSKKGPDSIIIGIGINVNNADFPPRLRDKASSLKLEGGKGISREKLFQGILEEFENLYFLFLSQGGHAILNELLREK